MQQTCVFVVDHADILVEDGQSIVHTIFSWCYSTLPNMVLICISDHDMRRTLRKKT